MYYTNQYKILCKDDVMISYGCFVCGPKYYNAWEDHCHDNRTIIECYRGEWKWTIDSDWSVVTCQSVPVTSLTKTTAGFVSLLNGDHNDNFHIL